MPVHGGERWLLPTLESLALEADPGIEVLFFDSSPGEQSSNIAQQFAMLLTGATVKKQNLDARIRLKR